MRTLCALALLSLVSAPALAGGGKLDVRTLTSGKKVMVDPKTNQPVSAEFHDIRVEKGLLVGIRGTHQNKLQKFLFGSNKSRVILTHDGKAATTYQFVSITRERNGSLIGNLGTYVVLLDPHTYQPMASTMQKNSGFATGAYEKLYVNEKSELIGKPWASKNEYVIDPATGENLRPVYR